MHLSGFTDYTLRALLYLGARRGDAPLATIGDIASAYAISRNHLTKVVHHLARHGYVKTTRGKGGGIRLARPPEKIGLGEVVRCSEENRPLIGCRGGGKPGSLDLPVCTLSRILAQALRAFYDVLDRHTLADLVYSPDKLETLMGERKS